jgi:hypothetical protein
MKETNWQGMSALWTSHTKTELQASGVTTSSVLCMYQLLRVVEYRLYSILPALQVLRIEYVRSNYTSSSSSSNHNNHFHFPAPRLGH